MTKFDHHFKMDEKTTIEFIKEKLPDYFSNDDLTCEEIGDGNINYVYRVSDGNKTLIVKHADAYFRNTDKPKNIIRSKLESKALMIEKDLCKENVPDIYYYDETMCAIVMQDIGDHQNMRYALIDHKIFPEFAKDITNFLVKTLIGTSIFGLSSEKRREYESKFSNHDMCEITDRLVLSEPYTNKLGSNVISEGNEEFVKENLYDNKKLHNEIAYLKNNFLSKRQSLIHGDLHSGSIFVKEDSTMVLDPEFAIMGPGGYDIGNVIAHLVFAYYNCKYTDDNLEFKKWIKETIIYIIKNYKKDSYQMIKDINTDKIFDNEDFINNYIDETIYDTYGYAGMEIIRRVVGRAKVKDLQVDNRLEMEKELILFAINLIMNRKEINVDNILD